MRTRLYTSLKTLFIVIFTGALISSLVSCGTVPKQVSLSPASPLVMPDEARKIGIVFNSKFPFNPDSNTNNSTDFVIERLRSYLGYHGDFIRFPDNSSEENILSSIPSDITNIVVVDIEDGVSSHYPEMTYKVSGHLSLYDVSINKRIAYQSVEIEKKESLVLGFWEDMFAPYTEAEEESKEMYKRAKTRVEVAAATNASIRALKKRTDDNYRRKEENVRKSIQSSISIIQLDPFLKELVIQYASYIEENRQPPLLATNIKFSDQQGFRPNNLLDAGEQVELIFTVENQGNGTAYDVTPVISTEGKGFTVGTLESLGSIAAKKSKEIRIPVVGGLELGNGQVSVLIETKEKRGYDAKKVRLSFQTARLERPDIEIKSVRVNDGKEGLASGNGNALIENGETAELNVFVENRGVGDAYGVRVSLSDIKPSGVEIIQKEGDIGQIGVGESAKGKIVVKVPRSMKASEFSARFLVEEVERKAVRTDKVFTLTGGTLSPELVVKVDWNDSESGIAHGNGNNIWDSGETIEGVLTVHNRGSLTAEDVELSLNAAGNGVNIGNRHFNIGRLLPGQTSPIFKTIITIPRTYNEKDAVIRAEVQQKDFPFVSERFVQAVTHHQPNLIVAQRILNNTDGGKDFAGSVMQGENTRLEIRVRNEGSLDAKGVSVEVNSDKQGVVLEAKKAFPIGTIAAGKTSEPILIPLRVLRSAILGDSGIKVAVSQEDFPVTVNKIVLRVVEEGAEEVKVAGESTKSSRPAFSVPAATNPVVIFSTPPSGGIVSETFDLVWDVLGDVQSVEVKVNGERLPLQTGRGIGLTEKAGDGQPSRFREKIPLKPGLNTIEVMAYDLSNKSWSDKIQVTRVAERGEIWAVVIGVSDYQNVPRLKYAKKDAESFYDYLTEYIGVPADHIQTLYDADVTDRKMRHVLGKWLKEKASRNDTVYIYFAGHGAPENDPQSDDKDGFEKYLLTVDADPSDLHSTAVSMKYVAEVFGRLNSDRVVFIVDSCFSGASAGRTILAANSTRGAILSEDFLERLSKGKGRVILSASRANEASLEDIKYGGGHGVFTYYLLEGLKGAADYSKDGLVDVDELQQYLSKMIPQATGQRQTPVKKGEVEGTLIVGKVK